MTMTDQPLIALQPLRHVCHASGNCCFGWRVRLVDDDEVERITRFGAEFGIPDPVDEGALRFEGGCVFLDHSDRLCRIHKLHGSEAKPRTCRQFPLRVTQTEEGVRIGIDPGCTSSWQSWRDGPELAAEPLSPPQERVLDPKDPSDAGAAHMERALIGLASQPGMTFARFVGTFTGDPSRVPDLPAGFAGRVAARLKAMRFERFLAHPMIGPGMKDPLLPVADKIATLDADAPPPWVGVLDAERDAFVLDMIRRQLFLRLGDPTLPPQGQALVMAAGVLACAWTDATPERFGPAVSSWARVMRMKAVWGTLMPRPETARWLVTGQA